VAKGEAMHGIEQVPGPDGVIRYRLAIRFPIYDATGKVRNIASLGFDVPQGFFRFDALYRVKVTSVGVVDSFVRERDGLSASAFMPSRDSEQAPDNEAQPGGPRISIPLRRLVHLRNAARVVVQIYFEEFAPYCFSKEKIAARLKRFFSAPFLLLSYIGCIPASIVIKKPNGQIIWANSNFEDWMGRPLRKLIGTTVFDLWPKPFAAVIKERDDAVAKGQAMQVIEQVPGPHGEIRHRLAIRFPIYDGTGKVGNIASFSFEMPEEFFRVGPLFPFSGPRTTSAA
jgi:hypothetical protein